MDTTEMIESGIESGIDLDFENLLDAGSLSLLESDQQFYQIISRPITER